VPRRNKSRSAVLGFLSWRPASGYDIRRAIAESVGNFWNESYGQIYPALRELERAGLARRSVEKTSGKPDRHVYSITEAGRRELRRWLEQPCDPHVYRVEVLIKLFFGGQASLETCQAHIARYRAEHGGLIARYEAIREDLLRDFEDDPRLPFWLLTVDCGLGVWRAYLEWCDRAEHALDTMAAAARTAKVGRRSKGTPRLRDGRRGGPQALVRATRDAKRTS
jgi:DNA-binding PadR family transcriptional regulator